MYLYKVIPEHMSLSQVPEGEGQYMNSSNFNSPALQPARAVPVCSKAVTAGSMGLKLPCTDSSHCSQSE